MISNQILWRMSEIESSGLDNAFHLWKASRLPDGRDDDAFEVFSIEQILKDAELSDSEIASGNFGGGGDGGVDGFYFFINRALILDDDFQPQTAMSAELVIIQSTLSPNFSEAKIQKLDSFCRNLLEWKPLDDKDYLSQAVRDAMIRFRSKCTQGLFLIHMYLTSTCTSPAGATILHPPM